MTTVVAIRDVMVKQALKMADLLVLKAYLKPRYFELLFIDE